MENLIFCAVFSSTRVMKLLHHSSACRVQWYTDLFSILHQDKTLRLWYIACVFFFGKTSEVISD